MTREEKIEQKKAEMKLKCQHNIVDGAGNYCSLMPMNTKDYPHKFLRTDCYGRKCNCKFKHLYKEKTA